MAIEYYPGTLFPAYKFMPLGKLWSNELGHPVAEVYGECMPGTFAYTGREDAFGWVYQGDNPHGEAYNSESYFAEIPNAAEHFGAESGWGVIVYGYCTEVPAGTPLPYSVAFYPYMGSLVEIMPGFYRDFPTRETLQAFVNQLNLRGLTQEYLLSQGFTLIHV